MTEAVTPSLLVETLVVLDRPHRSTTMREPGGQCTPSFLLARGAHSCAWAVNADVPANIANELDALAREEPASDEWQVPPVHSERYRALLDDKHVFFGPSFGFPADLPIDGGETCIIDDERLLAVHFRGWAPGEIAQGRAPVVAIVVDGAPVSVCFCARRSDTTAEAGVETAAAYRGRGLAPRVTAAWARAVRATGRIPLYSTSWDNHASLAVARKLGLATQATFWNTSARRARRRALADDSR
jgi:hypothetical protein